MVQFVCICYINLLVYCISLLNYKLLYGTSAGKVKYLQNAYKLDVYVMKEGTLYNLYTKRKTQE